MSCAMNNIAACILKGCTRGEQCIAYQQHDGPKTDGFKCDASLDPRLKGYEGYRVEVSNGDERRRFWVGKSTGWQPCHLEIPRRSSTGGVSAFVTAEDHIRVVSADRRLGSRR